MKRLNLLTLFITLFTCNAYAQKVYIGCPDNAATKPNVGFLDKQTVDLVIADGRTIPADSKVECDGPGIKQVLKNFLQSEFPSCKIMLLPDSLKASNPNRITIKLNITAYQASRSKLEWTGSVGYHVMIIDNRNGKAKKISEDISNDTSKPGAWGYKTAKTCLFTSFDKSNQDLVSFIESSLK
ncbi:MAG: hypothetical protein ACTHJ8_18570 [Mucilaginibacter sp.]